MGGRVRINVGLYSVVSSTSSRLKDAVDIRRDHFSPFFPDEGKTTEKEGGRVKKDGDGGGAEERKNGKRERGRKR